MFLKNKNVALTRKEIEVIIWGDNISCFDYRMIDAYILKLRRKLNVKSIEAVRGKGYKWLCSR